MNTSFATKQLRILSGIHSGASLDLIPGHHSLGQSDASDITITDWSFDAVTLHIGSDGAATAQWSEKGEPRIRALADFVPVAFGSVVVCFGPRQGNWPSDDELRTLVDRALGTTAAPSSGGAGKPNRAHLLPGAVIVIAAMVTAGWLITSSFKPVAAPPTLEMARASLQRVLDTTAAGRLQVTLSQGGLLVDGMVDSEEQARAVSASIAAQKATVNLVQRVSVASELAETIRSAVGLPGAVVVYKGQGAFEYSVKAVDVAATQAALDRVRVDLSPVVRRIDAVLEEPAPPAPVLPPMLASWVADGVSVVETRDGIKHMVVGSSDSPVQEQPVADNQSALLPTSFGRVAAFQGAKP